jgi:integrase
MIRQRLRYFTPKSIKKQPGGKTYGIRFTDPRDNQRKFYYMGETQEEAKKKLPEFNQMYSSLKAPSAITYRITINQGIEAWLKQKMTELANKNTVKRYEEIMNNFKEFLREKHFSIIYLDNLGQEHFEEFKEYRRNIKEKEPKTINFELDMLSNLFRCLKTKKYVNSNPIEEVKRLQEPHKEERWFDITEVKQILEYFKSKHKKIRWYEIFATFYYTGMRRNELRFLEWKDIDWGKGTILVRHKEGFKPKTDMARQIPIHPELLPILRGLPCNKTKYVFSNRVGNIISKDKITKKLKETLKILGFKDGKLHSFRHTWTAHSVMRGIPREVIKAIGGWKDYKMIDTYSHLHPNYITEMFKKTAFLKDS